MGEEGGMEDNEEVPRTVCSCCFVFSPGLLVSLISLACLYCGKLLHREGAYPYLSVGGEYPSCFFTFPVRARSSFPGEKCKVIGAFVLYDPMCVTCPESCLWL